MRLARKKMWVGRKHSYFWIHRLMCHIQAHTEEKYEVHKTRTTNDQTHCMAIGLCNSAPGKSALGWWRELQSRAQRQEDVSGATWVYIALCMALNVCACVWVPMSVLGLAHRSAVFSWKLWGIAPQHWSLPGGLNSSFCPSSGLGSKVVTTVQ